MKLELICFKTCPYAQRSLIVVREKGMAVDITFIDKESPPDWFHNISPLGQVPVLRVDDQVLFESAIICEYLDEISPPSLHPAEPLPKALNRAWIEFGSRINAQLYGVIEAQDVAAFDTAVEVMRKSLQRVEDQLRDGPYFNGAAFSLVDAAYAPPLLRLRLIKQQYQVDLLAGRPRLQAWAETLAQRPGVQRSLVEDFPQCYGEMIAKARGHLATRKT